MNTATGQEQQNEEFLSLIEPNNNNSSNNSNNNFEEIGNNYSTVPKDIRREIIGQLSPKQLVFDRLQNNTQLLTVSKEWKQLLGESRFFQLAEEFRQEQTLADFYLYRKKSLLDDYQEITAITNIFVDVPKAIFPIVDENGSKLPNDDPELNFLDYNFALQLADEPSLYELFSSLVDFIYFDKIRMVKIVLRCGFTITVEDEQETTPFHSHQISIAEGRPWFEYHHKLLYRGKWKVERHRPEFTPFHDALSMNYILDINQILFENPIEDEEEDYYDEEGTPAMLFRRDDPDNPIQYDYNDDFEHVDDFDIDNI